MFAVISAAPGPELEIHIGSMASALRGADSTPVIWCDARQGLAAAVVSRGIQSEDRFGQQPWVDDRICFVSDGYVDDRHDLAARLDIDAGIASRMSDGELLYRAYLRYGEGLPQAVHGHYAFAVLHRNDGRMLLCEDHVGSRGLYYADGHRTFVAASQIGSVLAHPAIERRPDLTALGLLVAPKMLARHTAIDSVFRLAGGDSVTHVSGEPANIKVWWKPEETPEIRYRDEREYVDHALDLLRISVDRALSGFGAVASTLSGGLDSSLVTAVAAQRMRKDGKRLQCFTAVPDPGMTAQEFPNQDIDESELAAELAQLHGNIDLTLVRPEGGCYLDLMSEVHTISHTAVRNGANHLWLLNIARATRAQGGRVVLIGARGNAVTSREGSSVLEILLRRNCWLQAWRLARQDMLHGSKRAPWRVLAGELRNRWRQKVRGHHAVEQRIGASLLRKDFQEQHQHFLDERMDILAPKERSIRFAAVGSFFCAADLYAHTGVEFRDPLANRRLIEASLAFPLEVHMAGGRSRGLAREMGRGIVPDSIRLRRRRGVQASDTAGLIALHGARYRQTLATLLQSDACCEIFDLQAAAIMLDELLAGRSNLWQAFTMERLLDAGSLIAEMGV